ncbi:MAG: lipocalin family protein [Bdellovibrionales bacterium]|nr:lipocalin family protein [Bdellovibrionales bacterium]
MKFCRFLHFKLILLLSFVAFFLVDARAEPPKTVPFVDLSRFAGNWYQISHKPLFFEEKNCACARQQLTATSDPRVIGVFNSCNKSNATGELQTIEGTAYNLDPATNAKFEVDFNLPFKGSYWVIGLDPDYRFTVVSDKHKYSLYILSKTPVLAPELYKEALALAAEQLDISKLVITDQENCLYP